MSKYDNIINLPHFHAPDRPYMSRNDRAAQFAPFNALKSLDDKEKIYDEEYTEEMIYVKEYDDNPFDESEPA